MTNYDKIEKGKHICNNCNIDYPYLIDGYFRKNPKRNENNKAYSWRCDICNKYYCTGCMTKRINKSLWMSSEESIADRYSEMGYAEEHDGMLVCDSCYDKLNNKRKELKDNEWKKAESEIITRKELWREYVTSLIPESNHRETFFMWEEEYDNN